jgi:beta-lactamase regulating signal transducer with metallopeptidase domain
MNTSHLCAQLLRYIAEPALRALALAALAGLGLAVGRVMDATIRLAVWTALLYAALAMPFLAWVAPAVRLPIPALPAAPSAPPSAPAGIRIVPTSFPSRVIARATPSDRLHPAEPSARRRTFSWALFASGLYVMTAGVLLAQLAAGFLISRRVRCSGRPVGDRRVLAALVDQSTRWGLASVPELAESSAVAVPVTLGMWHPIILLPTAWRAWREEKLQAVLAHELSHVVRKDALTRALAAIHRGVFWFSPLAWWLERQLAALAEQASDDAALHAGADRTFYAEVLVGFYQDLQGAVGRVRWEGVAMTSGKQAQRRVDRILDSSRRLSAGLRKPAWVALALLAAPVIYLLAAVEPVSANKLHTDAARMPAAEVTSPAAEPLWAGMQAPPAVPAAPTPAPAPAVAPRAPAPPPASSPAEPYSYAYSQSSGATVTNSEDDGWLLSCVNTDGCGDMILVDRFDSDQVGPLRKKLGNNFIFFIHNGNSYVIRDAATVKAAVDLFVPPKELARKQAALAKQQEELSKQQEALGKQQESVRVNVPSDLEARLKKVETELHELGPSATQDDLGRLQSELGDIQGYIGELQGKAAEEQGKLGSRQGELGAQQGELGRKQGELGEEEGRIAQGFRKMQGILKRALESGVAQRAPV